MFDQQRNLMCLLNLTHSFYFDPQDYDPLPKSQFNFRHFPLTKFSVSTHSSTPEHPECLSTLTLYKPTKLTLIDYLELYPFITLMAHSTNMDTSMKVWISL